MRRGEPRAKRTPTALRSSSYEGCVASSMLRPCGLGCHMLGPRRTACLGTTLIRNPASNGITSRPVPRPRRTGEDDSPNPPATHIPRSNLHSRASQGYREAETQAQYPSQCSTRCNQGDIGKGEWYSRQAPAQRVTNRGARVANSRIKRRGVDSCSQLGAWWWHRTVLPCFSLASS